jgi:integrase/recombinase XerD
MKQSKEMIISILYGCALRVSELFNLKVKDINIDNATITIWATKRSNDPALVPVPVPVLKMINQWITENKLSKNRYLLFSSRNKKLSRIQIHWIIKYAAEKAGIEKELTTHTFRRTRAIHLLDAGLPLEQVSRLLRHKYLSSTMIYLKISIKGLQQAIDKIDNQETDLSY